MENRYARSGHRRCYVKKGVFKNLSNFTGKNLSWSVFKLQAFRPLLQRDFNSGAFLWNLLDFEEHLQVTAPGTCYPIPLRKRERVRKLWNKQNLIEHSFDNQRKCSSFYTNYDWFVVTQSLRVGGYFKYKIKRWRWKTFWIFQIKLNNAWGFGYAANT